MGVIIHKQFLQILFILNIRRSLMDRKKLERNIKKREIENRIVKANSAIDDLELKIMQMELKIENMKDHIDLQKHEIEKAEQELNNFKED